MHGTLARAGWMLAGCRAAASLTAGGHPAAAQPQGARPHMGRGEQDGDMIS